MPVLVITVLRFLFVAIMQTAAWVVASQVLERVVDYIRATLSKDGELTDTEIDDTLLNEVLDALALIGVTVASLKTRLPIRLADKLGLSATKPVRKTLSAKAKAGIEKAATKGGLRKSALKVFLGGLALSFANVLLWFPQLVQQFGDQAAFAPAQANNFYESLFGVRPFKEPSTLESPPPFSKAEFTDYAQSLETQLVSGINDPTRLQSIPYSREALAELVFSVQGESLANGERLTVAKIIPKLPQYLIFAGKSASAPVPTQGERAASASVSNTKVFVGAIGSGRLSGATDFSPRPDDLIQNIEELEAALRNNLTAFLPSVLGRFVYETKVVSTVTSKDGFTQRGQVQQVKTGTNKDGTPKYKTVVNKFAVADVYFLSDRGTRTKAARIVLGPTDAVSFRPNTNDLGRLDLNVKNDVFTTSLSGVEEVKKQGTTTALPKAPEAEFTSKNYGKASKTALSRIFRAGASNGNPGPDQLYADTGKRIYVIPNLAAPKAGIYDSQEEYIKIHDSDKHYETVKQRLKDRYGIDFESLPARNIADLYQSAVLAGYDTQEQYDAGRGRVQNPIYDAESVEQLIELAGGADTTAPIGTGPACAAESLKQFFEARKETLPSVEVRSVLYEQYELGPRSFYTGTTEQNIKLLAKLKAQAGCSV